VEEDLLDEPRSSIHIFDLVRGHILSLLQFEDVFLAVDDLEGKSRCDLAHVTSMQPSLLVDSLLGDILHFVVALENLRTMNTELTSWSPLSLLVFVFSCVFHLRNIHQPHLGRGLSQRRNTVSSCIMPKRVSVGLLKKTAVGLSVCPYPSIRGHPIIFCMYSWVAGLRGALPEAITRTLPPKACLVLAKTLD
jgi:hypothetical protein